MMWWIGEKRGLADELLVFLMNVGVFSFDVGVLLGDGVLHFNSCCCVARKKV